MMHAVLYGAQTLAVLYSVDLYVRRHRRPSRIDTWFWFSVISIGVIWLARSIFWIHHACSKGRQISPHDQRLSIAFEGLTLAWASLWIIHLVLASTFDSHIVVCESNVLLSLYVAQAVLSAAVLGHWDTDLSASVGPAAFQRLSTQLVHRSAASGT